MTEIIDPTELPLRLDHNREPIDLYRVPDHLAKHYKAAKAELPNMRGGNDLEWALEYVTAKYAVNSYGSPAEQKAQDLVRNNPAEIDRWAIHQLKLEHALWMADQPRRDEEARMRREALTYRVCGEIGTDYPPARKEFNQAAACDACHLVAVALLTRQASTKERVNAVGALLAN